MDAMSKTETEFDEMEGNDLIDAARRSLAAAGFPVGSRRFPFSLHHQEFRGRLPRNGDGSKPTFAHVSALLREWSRERGRHEDYVWQAITGAVMAMVRTDPSLAGRLPSDIRSGMSSVASGDAFLAWSRSRLGSRNAST